MEAQAKKILPILLFFIVTHLAKKCKFILINFRIFFKGNLEKNALTGDWKRFLFFYLLTRLAYLEQIKKICYNRRKKLVKVKNRAMEKAKILVIEDEPQMAGLIAQYVKKGGMDATVCASAEEALSAIQKSEPHAILLDLNLPGMSGMEFLRKFRSEHKTLVPVIVVSGNDRDEDIIGALEIGADDFVTKPFSPRVLQARLSASLRRMASAETAAEETTQFGEYTILENSCVLKRGTAKVRLSAKEFDVLSFLVHHAGENLSPNAIFSAVWKVPFGDVTAVAVYIQRLRKKIERDPQNPEFIKTIFRYGYRFEIPGQTDVLEADEAEDQDSADEEAEATAE